mmetsp:Transcript_15918/g.41268  ORF Transcript_15918/g.41268 Transcript_15918/m.41268 type:complete len:130 (-) Transcript_15918:44-433(-)
MVEHGERMLLAEIAAQGSQLNGKSVLVLGRIQQCDHSQQTVVITHEHAELTVDVRMSPGVHLAKDAWFQFIGELEVQEQGGAILIARIARNVNGIDEQLYQEALYAQRRFLEELELVVPPAGGVQPMLE